MVSRGPGLRLAHRNEGGLAMFLLGRLRPVGLGTDVNPGDVAPDNACVARFLQEVGADQLPHAHGKSLFQHLIGTAEILERWGEPPWLCTAGLIHSVYSTDVYTKQLLDISRREEVRAVTGEEGERL